MHRHDLDLMAAYASGDLDDATRAGDLVATCEVCRDEYELHLSVLGQLSGLEQSAMSTAERAALRRDVWTEIRAGARAPHRASDMRTPLWYRWSAAAAGLFLVVGLLAVLSNRSDNEVFETIGNELSANGMGSSDGSGRASGGDQGELDGSQVDTTAAAGSSEEPLLPDGAPSEGGDGDPSAYEAMLDRVRQSSTAAINSYASEATAEDTAACLEKAGLGGQATVGDVDEETPYLLVVPPDAPFDEDTPITVVDSSTCKVVHVDVPPE